MREEAERRARAADSAPDVLPETAGDPADDFVAFELPSDEFEPGSIAAGAPSALPLDLRPTGAAPERTDSTPHRIPEARVRGRRRAVRSPRPVVSEGIGVSIPFITVHTGLVSVKPE